MTIKEISVLQLGDELEMPNGAIARVKSISQVERTIELAMLVSPTTAHLTLLPSDEITPPDNVNQSTTVICGWVDIISASKREPSSS
jgi:hypothetical protein